MREHRHTIELPHPAARLWALMQDYERWTSFAPMVLGVEVLHPGDETGNGLLRRVIFRLPLGRRGSALELITDVVPSIGYTYTMISRQPGNNQTGHLRLEPAGPNRTKLHFDERFHIAKAPLKWFEGPIYRFINKKNEESMRRMSDWLTAHPEYRPELAESEP